MRDQKVEKNLLEKAKQGDTAAFGKIIKKYQSLVYAVAVQILFDPAAAKDIAQDTFISAFKTLKNLRSEDSFPSWLHSIARNKALLWLKDRGRIVPLKEAGVLQSPPNPMEIEMEVDRSEAQSLMLGFGKSFSPFPIHSDFLFFFATRMTYLQRRLLASWESRKGL